MERTSLMQMSNQDLRSMLSEKQTELKNMRFKVAQGQLKNPKKINETRKIIARILTQLNKK